MVIFYPGRGEIHQMSKIIVHTQKEKPSDSAAISDQLLRRGGYVAKEAAGIFTLLPLGERVKKKINIIVREEMETIGAQEVVLPKIVTTDNWKRTGRLTTFGAMYQASGSQTGTTVVLNPTAEETVTPLAKSLVRTKKDLPLTVFQIGPKFRDEKEVNGGMLRSREFEMADGYHFNATESGAAEHYTTVKDAYLRVFKRVGVPVRVTTASGGAFSKKASDEFMAISPAGEDTIIDCPKCDFAENTEVSEHEAGCNCPKCGSVLQSDKAIEVANTFHLGTRFTEAFDFNVPEEKIPTPVQMTCFGIGITRTMAAIVEANHDDNGPIWPPEVAPYDVHVVELNGDKPGVRDSTQSIVKQIAATGRSVIVDDREARAGVKFHDADLIGAPVRLTNSARTVAGGVIEVKQRSKHESTTVPSVGILDYLKSL